MKKTFVYSALASVVVFVMNSAYAEEQKVEELDVIEVSSDASQSGLTKEFAGGQVAAGSRAGILGNKTNLENPFATTGYTNKFIQDKQARSVADVLKNDPNVRVARGFGDFPGNYRPGERRVLDEAQCENCRHKAWHGGLQRLHGRWEKLQCKAVPGGSEEGLWRR